MRLFHPNGGGFKSLQYSTATISFWGRLGDVKQKRTVGHQSLPPFYRDNCRTLLTACGSDFIHFCLLLGRRYSRRRPSGGPRRTAARSRWTCLPVTVIDPKKGGQLQSPETVGRHGSGAHATSVSGMHCILGNEIADLFARYAFHHQETLKSSNSCLILDVFCPGPPRR